MSSKLLKEYIQLALTEKIHNISKLKFNLLNFDLNQSLDDKLNYADEHLQVIGAGSSRIVYILSGKKVLKIAKNEKGFAQNEQEFNVFSDPDSKNIVAKIFDHADDFSWLISELTRPLKSEKEFANLLGLKKNNSEPNFEYYFLDNPQQFIKNIGRDNLHLIDQYYEGDDKIIKFAYDLKTFIEKYDLAWVDLQPYHQWGKSPDGRLVLIDYGYSNDIAYKYYM